MFFLLFFLFFLFFFGAGESELMLSYRNRNVFIELNCIVIKHYFYWLIVNITKLYRKRLLCCTRWNALILEFYTNERCESRLSACTFSIARQICETTVSKAGFVSWAYVSIFDVVICVSFQNALNNEHFWTVQKCGCNTKVLLLVLYN